MELKLETYVHHSLKEVVPPEIRKQVYRKAIEVIEDEDLFSQSGLNNLCFTLPCILFKEDHWIGADYLSEGQIAFPELTKKRIYRIESLFGNSYKYQNKFRKQILIEMLNELENK